MKIWVNGGKVVYDGIDLHFPKDVGVSYCSNIFWQGANGYEPHTWTVVKHFALHCDTFLDVGSNVGLYSVLVKKLNPRVRVEAFEPIPTIHHKNILFHRANGLDGENVWGHAVGDRDGQATIYLPVDSSSIEEETTATLRQDSWQFRRKGTKELCVQTIRIDTLVGTKLQECQRILMKIDVEDFEVGVLKGAYDTMRKKQPVLVCEILPRKHGNKETCDLLASCDYQIYGISREGLIRFVKEDFIGSRKITNFLLTPKSNIAPSRNFISLDDISAHFPVAFSEK